MSLLKQGKALKGELRLPSDRLQGQYACALALLAQGVSHLRGWDPSPEWDVILAFLERNGAAADAGKRELSIAALPGLRERTDWSLDPELPVPFAGAFLAMLSGLSTAARPVRVVLPPALRDRLAPTLDALRQGGYEAQDESDSESRITFHGHRPLRKAPSALGIRRTVWTFAALASGESFEFEELGPAQDPLENVLPFFDLQILTARTQEEVEADPEMARRLKKLQKRPSGRTLRVPATTHIPAVEAFLNGDVSLAAWAAVGACLRRGSDLTLRDVALPACRASVFTCLRKMGADLEFVKKSEAHGVSSGDLRVKASQLLGRKFDASDMAGLAEAAPFLAVAATHADKETVLGGLATLREGPVDLVDALASNLRALGLAVGVFPEGLVLRGEDSLMAERLDAQEHEGLALALHALASALPGSTLLENADCLDRFCPNLSELEPA